MLSNQVLPAIPRQKVKHKESFYGDGDVISISKDGTYVTVLRHMEGIDSWVDEWKTEDCEPVPEEPRPFRVGDKVKFRNMFTTISAIATYGDGNDVYFLHDGGQADVHYGNIRHATPEEIAKYF